MQFSTLAIFAAAALGVSATRPAGNVTVVTEVLTALTTYCPEPTQITYGDHTYTVTKVRRTLKRMHGRKKRVAARRRNPRDTRFDRPKPSPRSKRQEPNH